MVDCEMVSEMVSCDIRKNIDHLISSHLPSHLSFTISLIYHHLIQSRGKGRSDLVMVDGKMVSCETDIYHLIYHHHHLIHKRYLSHLISSHQPSHLPSHLIHLLPRWPLYFSILFLTTLWDEMMKWDGRLIYLIIYHLMLKYLSHDLPSHHHLISPFKREDTNQRQNDEWKRWWWC